MSGLEFVSQKPGPALNLSSDLVPPDDLPSFWAPGIISGLAKDPETDKVTPILLTALQNGLAFPEWLSHFSIPPELIQKSIPLCNLLNVSASSQGDSPPHSFLEGLVTSRSHQDQRVTDIPLTDAISSLFTKAPPLRSKESNGQDALYEEKLDQAIKRGKLPILLDALASALTQSGLLAGVTEVPLTPKELNAYLVHPNTTISPQELLIFTTLSGTIPESLTSFVCTRSVSTMPHAHKLRLPPSLQNTISRSAHLPSFAEALSEGKKSTSQISPWTFVSLAYDLGRAAGEKRSLIVPNSSPLVAAFALATTIPNPTFFLYGYQEPMKDLATYVMRDYPGHRDNYINEVFHCIQFLKILGVPQDKIMGALRRGPRFDTRTCTCPDLRKLLQESDAMTSSKTPIEFCQTVRHQWSRFFINEFENVYRFSLLMKRAILENSLES